MLFQDQLRSWSRNMWYLVKSGSVPLCQNTKKKKTSDNSSIYIEIVSSLKVVILNSLWPTVLLAVITEFWCISLLLRDRKTQSTTLCWPQIEMALRSTSCYLFKIFRCRKEHVQQVTVSELNLWILLAFQHSDICANVGNMSLESVRMIFCSG